MADIRTKVLLRSEESGGEVSVIDNVVPAGFPGRHCTCTTSTRRSTCSRASSRSRAEGHPRRAPRIGE
jgi:hypothetical protein